MTLSEAKINIEIHKIKYDEFLLTKESIKSAHAYRVWCRDFEGMHARLQYATIVFNKLNVS